MLLSQLFMMQFRRSKIQFCYFVLWSALLFQAGIPLPSNALAPSSQISAPADTESSVVAVRKAIQFLIDQGELRVPLSLIQDPRIAARIRSSSFFSSVYRRYQQLITQTPPYYLFLLEKAVHRARIYFARDTAILEIADASGNPAEIAGVILQMIQDREKGNGFSFDELIKLVPSYRRKQVQSYPQDKVMEYWHLVMSYYLRERKTFAPDIVFRPEAALVFNHRGIPYVFLGNFTSRHGDGTRLAEVSFNRYWFEEKGYEVIQVPKKFPFEAGADTKFVKHGDKVTLIFGWGYRTTPKAIRWIVSNLQARMGKDFKKVKVMKAHMISEKAYHLDTALKEIPVINEEGRIIDETIMYYPDVFDKKTRSLFRRKFPNALIISEDDVKNFACNSITIGKTIILDSRVSAELEARLIERGMKVRRVQLLEFYKAGGGAKCLVCELDQSPYSLDPNHNKYFLLIVSPRGVFDVQYVNDPYMPGMIGAINKGRADEEHAQLIKLIQEEGGEVDLLATDRFRARYDFQALFTALVALITEESTYRSQMQSLFEIFGSYVGIGEVLRLYIEEKGDTEKLEHKLKDLLTETQIKKMGSITIIDALFKLLLIRYNQFYYSIPEYSYNALMIALYEGLFDLVNSSSGAEPAISTVEMIEKAV